MPKRGRAAEDGAVTRSQARALSRETANGDVDGDEVTVVCEVSRNEKDAAGWKHAINVEAEAGPSGAESAEHVDLTDSDDEPVYVCSRR